MDISLPKKKSLIDDDYYCPFGNGGNYYKEGIKWIAEVNNALQFIEEIKNLKDVRIKAIQLMEDQIKYAIESQENMKQQILLTCKDLEEIKGKVNTWRGGLILAAAIPSILVLLLQVFTFFYHITK